MAVYLGSEKVKINFNGTVCKINLVSLLDKSLIITDEEDTILLDSDGTYLLLKEEVE